MSKLRSNGRAIRKPRWIKERLDVLSRELETCADSTRRREIHKELLKLRRMIAVPPIKESKPRKLKGDGKSSMFAASSAGWIQFVQGGAPGNGKGGRRK